MVHLHLLKYPLHLNLILTLILLYKLGLTLRPLRYQGQKITFLEKKIIGVFLLKMMEDHSILTEGLGELIMGIGQKFDHHKQSQLGDGITLHLQILYLMGECDFI